MTSVGIAQKFEELADGTDKENNYEKSGFLSNVLKKKNSEQEIKPILRGIGKTLNVPESGT